MNIHNMFYNSTAVSGVSGFFTAYGSFGIVNGSAEDINKIKQTDNGYIAEYSDYSAICECKEYENGVYIRKDRFLSKTNGLVLGGYFSRFF